MFTRSAVRLWCAVVLVPLGIVRADPIRLAVDARDVSKNIVHVVENIPATKGAMTLAFPRWLPGYHAPDGKVVNLVDLHMDADGKPLNWKRDDVELDQFHVNVPNGATNVKVAFDFLLKDDDVGRDTAVLEWNNVVLYPIPSKMTDVEFAPTVTLPAGWEYASALHATGNDEAKSGSDSFAPVSLMTLIDSPLFAGRYHKSYDIGAVNGTPHRVEVFADSPAAAQLDDDTLAAQKKLPIEAFALFGAQHYSNYTWLVGLSDSLGWGGLEHPECSDNRMNEDSVVDDSKKSIFNYLLAHEYVHSWNGKHRRPAGMVTDDYQQPQKTDLLWVYEGLTEYWGLVLATRSGAWSDQDFRDAIAGNADEMNRQSGRDWRSLRDVATSAPQIYDPPKGNSFRRRHADDFYTEGTLIWLDVDVKIRNLTDGKNSLDDFAKRFYGGEGGKPSVETYTFDDVVSALNEVAPFDWKTFLNDRVNVTTATAPMGGITDGGYTLTYTDEASDLHGRFEATWDYTDLVDSIGLKVSPDEGTVDVQPGSAADKAGVPVGGKILAVDGLKYSDDRLRAAVAGSKATPIELIVEQREHIQSYKLDYNAGPRYPTLKRDDSKPDRLAEITKPLVAAEREKGKKKGKR